MIIQLAERKFFLPFLGIFAAIRTGIMLSRSRSLNHQAKEFREMRYKRVICAGFCNTHKLMKTCENYYYYLVDLIQFHGMHVM